MVEGPNPGTSSLTVDSAASVLEGLFSDEENTQPTRETPPTQEETASEPKSEAEETTEPVEEADDESAETEEVEEGDEPADEPSQPRTYRVKVDGAEVEVTEDELLKGYSRTADYTRKTQQLSDERKKFEPELQSVRAERQQYATALKQLETALAELAPQEPDWAALRQQDPAEFAATWAEYQQYQARQASIRAERERAEQKVQDDQRGEFQKLLNTEKERLLEAIPEWKDSAKAKVEKAKVVEFAKGAGFSDEELSQVYDHRALVLLRKAWLYDQAQKNKPVVRQKIEAVKVVQPGPAATAKKPPVSKGTKARQRLAKTGRVTDAAAALMDMIED